MTTKKNEEAAATGVADKAEWVALMCVIAEHDRDLYRQLRAEAWESVARTWDCSTHSN